MEEDFKTLQQENYQLREYVLSLQARLLESSSDLPPPPPEISLQQTQAQRLQQQLQQTAEEDQLRRDLATSNHAHDESIKAPTATMAGPESLLVNDEPPPLPHIAVQQLQAAAAQAGELGQRSDDFKLVNDDVAADV